MGKLINKVIIGITAGLYLTSKIYNFIEYLINSSNHYEEVINYVGILLAASLIVAALIYTIITNKLTLGLILSLIKITALSSTTFLTNMMQGFTSSFQNFEMILSLIYFILSVIIITLLIIKIFKRGDEVFRFQVNHFLAPMMVLAYLFVFVNPVDGIIAALAEMIAFGFLAVIAAELLFISVFITVPFNFIYYLITNNNDLSTIGVNLVLEWVIGVLLLTYGIYKFLKYLLKKDKTKEQKLIH